MREDAQMYEYSFYRSDAVLRARIEGLEAENENLRALVHNGIAAATLTYQSGMTCPCCGGTQFIVGHSSAECATCDAPFALAHPSRLATHESLSA